MESENVGCLIFLNLGILALGIYIGVTAAIGPLKSDVVIIPRLEVSCGGDPAVCDTVYVYEK